MESTRLMDEAHDALRVHHYSLRTEQAYLHWIKRFILFHGKRHPRDMGAEEIAAFLTHLAVNKHVSADKRLTRFANDEKARCRSLTECKCQLCLPARRPP